MGQVIYVDFRRGRPTLREARQQLGSDFKKALLEWSLEHLEQTIAGSWMSGASDAYQEVLRFRLNREMPEGELAPVLLLAA